SKIKRMRKLILLICAVSALIVNAQNITLENIWGGKYYAQGLRGINPMNDGKHYSINEQTGIYQYSYESFIDKSNSQSIIISGSFDDYAFSSDEKYMLLATDSQPIYRHSFTAKWQVYDLNSKTFKSVFDGKPAQEPTFSPVATKVGFVFENNLYYQDLSYGIVTQITTDCKKK